MHGLDDALGISHTRLHTAGFIFGATGCTLMFLFITWIMTVDYPLIVGGKPYFALPAWIPVIFEVTVLSASVGMVIVYMVRNGLSAIRPAKVLDPRATDDKFIMVFERDEMDDDELEVVTNLLNTNGASEVNEKEIY